MSAGSRAYIKAHQGKSGGGGAREGVKGEKRGARRRGEGRGEEGVMNLCRYRSEKFRHYGALLCTGVLHVVDGRALSYFPDWLLANSINFTRHSSTKVRGWEHALTV